MRFCTHESDVCGFIEGTSISSEVNFSSSLLAAFYKLSFFLLTNLGILAWAYWKNNNLSKPIKIIVGVNFK